MENEYVNVFIDSGAGFLKYTNKVKINELKIPKGTSFIKAVTMIGIPEDQVGFISVNGTKKEKEQIASDQDTIRPLPYIISG